MEKKDLLKLLGSLLKQSGFVKGKGNIWIMDQARIVLIANIRTSSWSKYFYLDFGIMFKDLQTKSIEELKIDDAHLMHSMVNILMESGLEQDYLEQLFTYDHSDKKVLENITTLFDLINKKVFEKVKQFNDYRYLLENFEQHIAYKPYFVFFENTDFYISFFKNQIKAN